MTSSWAIPGVGELHAHFDRVVIVSPTPVRVLKTRLPDSTLSRTSHYFNITTYAGKNPKLRSKITVSCAQDHNPLAILKKYEALLGRYSVVDVEVAFDTANDNHAGASETLLALVGQLRKPWHRRGHLRVEHKPYGKTPAGCVPEPTFYFEDRKAGVKLKAYMRHQKLAGGGFAQEEHTRLEWTLSRKPAIKRYLYGNKLDNLIRADLNKFLARNLRLERIDHIALGNLFRIKTNLGFRKPPTDEKARRAAYFVLRCLAYRETRDSDDGELMLWICQNSPAQVRGYLMSLRNRTCPRRYIRSKQITRRRKPITDYRINRCFKRVRLSPYNYYAPNLNHTLQTQSLWA
jgi:hypothetical protein